MELKQIITKIPYANPKFEEFVKKWQGYVIDNGTPTGDDFNLFTNKGNHIAGSGSYNLDDTQKTKFKESWSKANKADNPTIKDALKKVVEADQTKICELLKAARVVIEEAIKDDEDEKGKEKKKKKGIPHQQINRMLITISPKYLINIPNEDITKEFAKQLIEFGYEYKEDSDSYNWINRSMDIKAFIDKELDVDENKYVNYWSICENLKNMVNLLDLLKANYNLILTGAPGTGKTYLARQIAAAMIGCKTEELLTNKDYKDQFGFVQFHPSYDYTDFVEGLRPVHKENSTDIVFERKDGTFMKFCRTALEAYKYAQEHKEEPRKYVFVIDEINRGEISKIFGELFFSIDPGYRGKEGSVSTQYSNLWVEGKTDFDGGEKFYVPENVYVIGTMNDIDRSVESMDFAFRRRFAFREIKADDRIDDILCDLDNDTEDAKKKMKAINGIIGNSKELGLGQQYKLGPAYFKNIKKYDGKDKWDKLWENHIEGVLREYLRGRPSKDIENEITKMKNEYGKNTGNNGEDDNPEGQSNDTESGTGTTAQ